MIRKQHVPGRSPQMDTQDTSFHNHSRTPYFIWSQCTTHPLQDVFLRLPGIGNTHATSMISSSTSFARCYAHSCHQVQQLHEGLQSFLVMSSNNVRELLVRYKSYTSTRKVITFPKKETSFEKYMANFQSQETGAGIQPKWLHIISTFVKLI